MDETDFQRPCRITENSATPWPKASVAKPQPLHESEDDSGEVEDDGTDGEPRRVGGPDLAPEAIVELLRVAERGDEDHDGSR